MVASYAECDVVIDEENDSSLLLVTDNTLRAPTTNERESIVLIEGDLTVSF